MIEVDLDTRVLPREHEVFFARPGEKFRFYNDFVQGQVVAPDLPGLQLDPGIPVERQPKLNARIRMARTVRDWHRAGRPADRQPSRNVEDYRNTIGDGGIAQLRGVVVGYFGRAKKGDLVLVVPGAYSQLAFVGEFLDDPGEVVRFNLDRFYRDDPLLARRVRWLASTEKRFLPRPILEIVAKPNAFVSLPRSVWKDVYRLAYTSFTVVGEYAARFDVSDETYDSFDDVLLAGFFNFVATNTRAISEGREQDVRGILEGAFEDAGEFTPELDTEISSPGFLRLTSLHIVPLVATVLFALAVEVGPAAADAAMNGTLTIGNSKAPPGDPCVAAVHDQTIRQLQILGADDRWAQACEKARQAAAKTGARGSAKVKQ
jgi:hypothetical protein